MTEFTPGPWKAHRYKPDWQCATVRLSDNTPICDVFTLKDENVNATEARAHLIASVLDLLTALEALADDEPCRYDHSGFCQEHTNEMDDGQCAMNFARATIAKARGTDLTLAAHVGPQK